VLAVALLVCAQAGWAQVAGKTTLETRIVPAGGGAFTLLGQGPGEGYTTREDGVGAAQAGREGRRRSILYFGQLSDFQLADEESPARVENVDNAGGPVSAAWRPMEALGPHTVDQAVRQVNAFAAASPLAAGGRRARMEFAITTGDSADSQQLNETRWVVRLLEGGTIDPNSGVGDGSCGTDPAEAPRYTGVSDMDDYIVPTTEFYDPDEPQGPWAAWPQYPGLLDRAQVPFQTPGLDVPTYVTFGNHDALAQGNQAANAAFEAVGVSCVKPLGAATGILGPVPPDPARQYVSKAQYKEVHRTPESPDAHGFGMVDPAEQEASRGAAGYYSWSPKPGFRFIALDTVCDGGVAGPSADGNIDDPQFRWLRGELEEAGRADELVVLFSHHAIPSLTCVVVDEVAPPCLGQDSHGHDQNPGCDVDPRSSTPVHLGPDLERLLLEHPHVAAWVAGHSHVNSIEPYRDEDAGFWSIRVAAEIDWPQQSRLLEFMDNRDGTVSIFGTILDHVAPIATPPSGTAATAFDTAQLASLSRLFAANDPQGGIGSGEGGPADRNVELLLRDPRRNPLDPTSGQGGTARRCASLRGRIRGRRVHRAVLGLRRAAIRRRYPSRRRSGRRVDNFCLADGKRVRVRYSRRRAIVISTTSSKFKLRRVRVGMGRRAFRRRIRGERRLRGGWWVARGRRSTPIFRVRRGRVRQVGIAARRATRTPRASRRALRRF
jgi:metallophosphoesterase (TIGR03767 family)